MVVHALEPRGKLKQGPAHPLGKPFGEQTASVHSVGWAGKRQWLQLVCTTCKLSKSIIKSKKCQIHDPVYTSGGRKVKANFWVVTHRLKKGFV